MYKCISVYNICMYIIYVCIYIYICICICIYIGMRKLSFFTLTCSLRYSSNNNFFLLFYIMITNFISHLIDKKQIFINLALFT